MIVPKNRILAIPCLVGLTLLLLNGCSPARKPATPIAVTPVHSQSALSAAEHVQSLPLYQKAASACRHKQFIQAAALMQRLAASPLLSAHERAFCQQQQAICLQNAGMLPRNTPAPPAASLPAQEADCGPRALAILCQRLGIPTSVEKLRRLASTSAKGTSMEGLAKAAQALGLQAEGVQVNREALLTVQLPALAWTNGCHYIVVFGVQGDGDQATAQIEDPNQPHEQTIAKEQLLRLCSGYLLLVHPG